MPLSFSHDDPKQKTSFNIPLFAMVSREVLALISVGHSDGLVFVRDPPYLSAMVNSRTD